MSFQKVINNIVLPSGLVNMHAYTVTGITEVRTYEFNISLLNCDTVHFIWIEQQECNCLDLMFYVKKKKWTLFNKNIITGPTILKCDLFSRRMIKPYLI